MKERDRGGGQDLSPDRIARLILHILFLKNSKSVTLILTWPGCACVCVCVGGGGGGGEGRERGGEGLCLLYQIGTKSIV